MPDDEFSKNAIAQCAGKHIDEIVREMGGNTLMVSVVGQSIASISAVHAGVTMENFLAACAFMYQQAEKVVPKR